MVKKLDPQKHADQKNRLLAHARHLFAVQGVKETSMSQMAQACEVTKATLYHYFKSKESILKEIFDCRSKANSMDVPAAKAKNLEECLTRVAHEHLAQMQKPERAEEMKLIMSELIKNKEVRNFHMESLRESVESGAREVAAFIPERKTKKELQLLYYQFVSILIHYTWSIEMLGNPSGFIGDEKAFVRQLVKTYTLAFQAV